LVKTPGGHEEKDKKLTNFIKQKRSRKWRERGPSKSRI